MVPSGFVENRSAGGLPEPPREKYWATWALVERERGGQGWAARPLPSGPNWTRRRGRRPPFLLPLPLPFPLLVGVGKRGILLLLGGGFLLLACHRGSAGLPLAPLYTGAEGTSRHTS